ncbi:MAG TPA: hypothetical protein VMG41_05410 [Gemmatimonadales bacterium]|nr:hypothetical protein [Gemmatimonadales bacterium]
MRYSTALAALLLAASQLSCSYAGADLGFGARSSGSLQAQIYFDRDGSGTITGADTVRSGILVRLFRIGISTPSDSDTTSALGSVQFTQIPPGYYAVVVDSTFLDDTIVAVRSPLSVAVRSGAMPAQVQIALAPPILTMRQVKLGTVGRLAIVGGAIRAGQQSYSDTSAYVADTSGSLRLERAKNADGTTTNQPGDVVRVRGRIAFFNGQQVLDSARIFTFAAGTPAPPDTLTTSLAALANGGLEDAALVRVVGATILDTATVTTGFAVGVSDGTGRVVVLIDPRLGATLGSFTLNSLLDATGILIPDGSGSWQLWPRTTNDYLIH